MPLYNQGVTGPQGPTGIQGPTGAAGITGVGYSGEIFLNQGVTFGQFNAVNYQGAGVTATATGGKANIYIAGGAAPVGPSGTVQYNGGSALAAATGVIAGANFISIGSGASTGVLRLPNQNYIYFKDSSGNDRQTLGTDASGYLQFGAGYIQVAYGADDFIMTTPFGAWIRGGNSVTTNITTNKLVLTETTSTIATDLTCVAKYLITAKTSTVTALTNTNLTFPIAASEIWEIVVDGTCTCSSTGGVSFGISAPTGASIDGGVIYTTSAATSVSWFQVPSINTAVGAAATTASTVRPFSLKTVIINSTTAGTIAFAFGAVTAGQTATINTRTKMIARRLTGV